MKKIIKFLFLISIIFFLVVYFGRNNIITNQNMTLTEEAIHEFEKDLKEGKEIIPSNYMPKKKDYNNKASKVGLEVSRIIDKVSNKVLKRILKSILNE